MRRPALAQPAERVRRIALVLTSQEHDPESRARGAALRESLRGLGWVEGSNLRIDTRWSGGDVARTAQHAEELAAQALDVIVCNGTPQLAALKARVRDIPIVFVVVTDPVGAGFVESLARPGGNITGFATYEPELGGKWLDTLREFEPELRRAAIVTDPAFAGFRGLAAHVHAQAAQLGVAVREIAFRAPGDDVEAAIAEFAREPGGGLIVIPTALNLLERRRIVDAASRGRLPAIYPFRPFVEAGGLMSYGFEPLDLFRRSAGYVDRILRGERPTELPVQFPTRFELVVNRHTARALGRDLSAMLLARADEVIE
jgi:putative ABC transport system substrate-binding protein